MSQESLQQHLDAWMAMPDWEGSAAYMRGHSDVLMTAAAQAVMQARAAASPDAPEIVVHADLLAICREQGIEAGYQTVLNQLAASQDDALLSALMEVRDSGELSQLAQSLTVGGLDHLIELGDNALTQMQGSNVNALRQRLDALKTMRAQINSPLWTAIREYLDAESDAEAGSILHANVDLLFTPEAEEALDGMEGSNEAAQSRLLARRALWRRAKALTEG